MTENRDSSAVAQLVAEILDGAPDRNVASSTGIWRDFEAIARRDYERDLSRHFSPRELRTLLAAVEMALPRLNHEQFTLKPLEALGSLASRLGARFKACKFTGADGLALLGFYANDRERRERPLICVNTAHHPAAVAAAFWHEVGHHLTARIFDACPTRLNLSFSTGYGEHLEDPWEVVADIPVCLAAYPSPVARRLFADPLLSRAAANGASLTDEVLSKSRAHLRTVAVFDFENCTPAMENLHYLAGMIHFARLRRALFAQYEI
jgi:hypothetical protein